jgi:hypothetical protein
METLESEGLGLMFGSVVQVHGEGILGFGMDLDMSYGL